MGGNFYEYPNPTGDETNRQYESRVEKGDIVAAFFGHDHTNSFYGRKRLAFRKVESRKRTKYRLI